MLDRPWRLPYAQAVDPSPRSGRPGPSQRERLREAMVRVAAEKGYAATTVTEVVEAAGVSSATFYELFDDKEACFLEAFAAVNDVIVAHVARRLCRRPPASPGRNGSPRACGRWSSCSPPRPTSPG